MRPATTVLAVFLAVVLVASLTVIAWSQDRGDRRGGRRGGPSWDRLKAMDANGDGKVSREEFRGPSRMWDRVDTDKDGFVTEAEFKKATASRAGGSRNGGRGANTDWMFELLDRDQDKELTERDLLALRKAADANGDGKLTKDEFLAFLKKRSERPSGTAPTVGSVAPAFELQRLGADGKTTSLESLLAKKRPVVIAFGSYT